MSEDKIKPNPCPGCGTEYNKIFLRIMDLQDALAARDATIAELRDRDIVRCTTINILHEVTAAKDKRIAELEKKLRICGVCGEQLKLTAKDKRIAEFRNALSEYVLLVDFATLNGFAKLDPAALERHQAVKQSLLTQD